MMMPNVLNDNDINYAHFEGLKNLVDTNGEQLNMHLVFNEIFNKKD